ncbi:hypothetical protein DFH06DRAFT_720716 [Mycena polygramma]|nr:hypothetical protein DFH06DRAFT_720716 [Mycena polygramma]
MKRLPFLRRCAILKSSLPNNTYFPEDKTYEEQQLVYYSAEQREMTPACRVAPESAGDLSLIVQIAKETRCTFALKSGGHMNWGGSNVGPSGFTIDLGRLTAISVLPNDRIISFGSGCVWRDVYEALAPYNLTTVGGRASNVGVGGFLLGGGMSFLSIEHGLGSANIVNYLVVLADGTIANANETSLPDLYWALKYGSTNFGIVARFDMHTYPLGPVWGGLLHLPLTEARPMLNYLVNLIPNLASDPKGMAAVVIGWNPQTQDYVVSVIVNYREPTAFPALFAHLQAVEPLHSTLRLAHLVSLTDELVDIMPSGSRSQWISLTIVPDPEMMLDLFKMGKEIFDPHRGRAGFSWAVTFQPINAGLAAAGSRSGGNPTGLSAESGDLVLYCGAVIWQDPTDDAILKAAVQEYLSWARVTAEQRGLLNRFVYLNYALGTQDVFGGVGKEDLDELRRIQSIYDPHSMYKDYWVGGYKL